MSAQSDRNLLLGILALQMDFIDREQLIAATNVWAVDKVRPLDEILLEQRALRADTHPLLVALVDKHLEMHGGDAEKSLSAVSSLGSVRDALNRLGDAEIEASMSLVATDHDPVDPYATEVPTAATGSADGARFRVLRPHAKGGLGEVFVAQDDELNREVALKEIQTQYAHDTESRSRFLLEAEVTGGLEHPGIVPVYGLGQYGDGRPYYAMRFIRGDSLAEAIDRFHGNEKPDAPAHEPISYDSVEFRKLLGRFVDVCNAIGYAHSRGVLHRDLKPGNIMLGKYGETLVVDWGLAKLQGRDEETKVAGETTLQPSSGSGSAPTQFGSALGTPAYMPPEQAAGQLDQLGPQSDVYSLGATLYHLLAGQAPVAGSDIGQLLKKVQQGDFPSPRQVKSHVPKLLNAICLKAMATRPQDRYASPQDLADDAERFLADEPVGAYSEPLVDRARRWVRKHQTFAATTAAAFLLITIGLGVVATISINYSAKLEASNKLLAIANGAEKEARKEAETNAEQAATNAEIARLHGDLTFATLSSVVNDIQLGLRDVPGGGEIRRRLLKTALDKLDRVVTKNVEPGTADRHRILALFELGDVVLQFGVEETVDETDESEPGDSDAELQKSAVELASTLYDRAHNIAVKIANQGSSGRKAQRDLSTSFQKLGDIHLRSGRRDEAIEAYEAGLEVTKKLVAVEPDDTILRRDMYFAHNRIGRALLQYGVAADALAAYQQCADIAEGLVEDIPTDDYYKRLLSNAYESQGDVELKRDNIDSALKLYQSGVDLKGTIGSNDSEAIYDLFVSYNKYTNVQIEIGRFDEALANCRKSLAIARKVVADDRNDERAKRELTYPLGKMGDIYMRTGQFGEALDAYQEALEIDKKSVQDDSNDARAHLDLAVSHRQVGEAFEALQDFSAAVQEYRVGADVARRMLDRGMLANRAQYYVEFFERAANTAVLAPLAFGDWDTLLEQPADTVPKLLDRRGEWFVRRGRFDDAAEAAEKLSTLTNASARQLYVAAKILGECAAVIRTEDGESLTEEQTKRRERYLASSAATMRKAFIQGAIQIGRPLSANPGTGEPN